MDVMIASVFHIMAFAFLVSLCISGFMMAFKITFVPRQEAFHKESLPTAGGLGIVAGLFTGLMALRHFYPALDSAGLYSGLLGLGMIVAMVGLLDDRFEISSQLKLILLAIICLATPYITGVPFEPQNSISNRLDGGQSWAPTMLYLAGAVWVFVFMLAIQSIDRIKGLMGGYMIVTAGTLAVISYGFGLPEATLLCSLLCASILGFLPYNFRQKAQVLSGNTGALFVGYIFAASALFLAAKSKDETGLYVGPILILPVLVDFILTKAISIARGDGGLPHKQPYLYERMIRRALGQNRDEQLSMAWGYMRVGIVLALFVAIGFVTGLIASWAYFLLSLVIGLAVWRRLSRV